jgi:hypothetical protein
MIKEKEIKGWTQVFATLFKGLKEQGVKIEKAKVIELKPLKPIEEEARNGIYGQNKKDNRKTIRNR